MRHGSLLVLVALAVGCGVGPNPDAGEPLPEGPSEGPPTGAGSSGTKSPAGGEPGGGGTPPAGNTQPVASGAFAGAPAYKEMIGPSTIDRTGKGNGHLSFD